MLPIVAGALAGAAVAVIIATSTSSRTTATTTVIQPARGATLPTSLTSTRGLTVNQIYRQAGPGVVDITVTSQANNGGSLRRKPADAGRGRGRRL